MRKYIDKPDGMHPQLRYAIDCMSNAHYAYNSDERIGSASSAIEALKTYIHCEKIRKERSESKPEQPFTDDIRYVYPENGAKELVVVTTNLEKPWVAVDEALEKVGISRTDIIKTEYSYLHDEKEGRFIECRMTLA